MSTPLGVNAKLLYRSTGSHESPTFTELDVSDLSVDPVWDKGDASSRASRGKRSLKTMLGLTVTGKLKKRVNDAGYNEMMNAMVSDAVLDILVLDGDVDTDGARGWRFDAQVYKASDDQGLGTVGFIDFELDMADSDNEVQAAYVTGSGGLQFSDVGGDDVEFS